MTDQTETHGKAIVVATRGHVWVGDAETGPQFTTIKAAQVVRRWGTSEGLNQLAMQGPQPNTRLDAPADLLLRPQHPRLPPLRQARRPGRPQRPPGDPPHPAPPADGQGRDALP